MPGESADWRDYSATCHFVPYDLAILRDVKSWLGSNRSHLKKRSCLVCCSNSPPIGDDPKFLGQAIWLMSAFPGLNIRLSENKVLLLTVANFDSTSRRLVEAFQSRAENKHKNWLETRCHFQPS